MLFEFDGNQYQVNDITRRDRRKLAALRAALYTFQQGIVWQNGPALDNACEETLRLSGLDEAKLEGMTPTEENRFLLALMAEYAGELSGKGSGD